MSELWPWVALALLGAYHGLNPAMGWLFAVSRGLQERSRREVLRSLVPIAIGHELALVLVAAAVLGLGVVTDAAALKIGAAAALIAFGLFRFVKPRAHPTWRRVRVNRYELGLWSFLMSSAHGAGLMVAPILIGSGTVAAADDHSHGPIEDGVSLSLGALAGDAAGLVIHVGAMLVVMGVVAVLVYDRFGVGILRKAWINLDHVWAAAFVLAGIVTLFT